MTVTNCSLTSCVWDRFWIGSHTMPGQQHSQPTPTSLGQKCMCVFRCNLPPALLVKWPGSYMCHCVNTGVERTPNMSQRTKLTLEKKIQPLLLPGFKLATFWSQVWRSNQQAILAPLLVSCHESLQNINRLQNMHLSPTDCMFITRSGMARGCVIYI